MSTTAGAGTQDYVAINSNLAVVCLACSLGIMSVLAFLSRESSFYCWSAAGLVCGVIALMQIRGSNKTQSGIALAVLGVLLSLGIGGGWASVSGRSIACMCPLMSCRSRQS